MTGGPRTLHDTTNARRHRNGMKMQDPQLIRIQSEYRETPGLKLTAAQASRFWNLGPNESRQALESLVEAAVLGRTHDGHYILIADSPRALKP